MKFPHGELLSSGQVASANRTAVIFVGNELLRPRSFSINMELPYGSVFLYSADQRVPARIYQSIQVEAEFYPAQYPPGTPEGLFIAQVSGRTSVAGNSTLIDSSSTTWQTDAPILSLSWMVSDIFDVPDTLCGLFGINNSMYPLLKYQVERETRKSSYYVASLTVIFPPDKTFWSRGLYTVYDLDGKSIFGGYATSIRYEVQSDRRVICTILSVLPLEAPPEILRRIFTIT
jgi:hypothetical protein